MFVTLCIIFVLQISTSISAQEVVLPSVIDTNKIYRVELKEGSIFIGKIINRDIGTITMKTTAIASLNISIASIKTFTAIEQENIKEGVFWFPNPNATRYLFGPTAFSLAKGEGYYQNTYLFLNSFNYGVTNHFTMGAGVEIISLFGGYDSDGPTPIIFLTPKYTWNLDPKWNVGTGVIFVSIPNFDSETSKRNSAGIAYGIGTYGNIEHNLTLGLGWGFVESEMMEQPIVTFSGMTRFSKKTAFVTENWLVPIDGEIYGIYSYGIRFFGEKIAVDLAFLNNPEIFETMFIGVPYIDFVVKF